MAVGEHDVRHVADLARLGLEPDRIPLLAAELNGILARMDVLASVPVEGVEPMAAPPAASRLTRPDEPGADPLVAGLEEIAPRMRDGFFLVPRLAVHEDAG